MLTRFLQECSAESSVDLKRHLKGLKHQCRTGPHSVKVSRRWLAGRGTLLIHYLFGHVADYRELEDLALVSFYGS